MSAGFEGNAAFHFAGGKWEGGTVIGMDVAVDSPATAFRRHVSQDRHYRYAADAPGALVQAVDVRPCCAVSDLVTDQTEAWRACVFRTLAW